MLNHRDEPAQNQKFSLLNQEKQGQYTGGKSKGLNLKELVKLKVTV